MPEEFSLGRLFSPNSVAIVGASLNPFSGGYQFTRFLIDHGFQGKLYLVNPTSSEILGLKVYPRLTEIPESSVDYVISCIPAEGVLSLLEDCGKKNVKLVHLFTARLKETGRDKETKLQFEILEKARKLGIRILGPNCMGIYYPKLGLSFNHELPRESGPVGGFFQSGGGAGEFVRYAALRGVRFSKIISYGNASDVDETELLNYFTSDSETKVIASYIEGVKDGGKFAEALALAAKKKPVIILKGGRGRTGAKLALSHTASLAGSVKVWQAVLKQYGAIMVSNFQELIDQVVAFTFLPPIIGRRVIVAGGGGGKSMVSADVWEEEGFELPELSVEFRKKLKEKVPEIWDWVRNPIDASLFQGAPLADINLLEWLSNEDGFDILVANLTQDDPLPNDIWEKLLASNFLQSVMAIKKKGKPVVCVIETGEIGLAEMKSWKWRAIAETRRQIINQGLAVFPSPERAAQAKRRLVNYWAWRESENELL
ncbi:MAG: CoA-binding protein [Dehalococcoidia bacterium]|nr:CoA-binding protein [Dehalococcoidia bacterium]